jgi:O-acetyl-ADP-ribose deacetylase
MCKILKFFLIAQIFFKFAFPISIQPKLVQLKTNLGLLKSKLELAKSKLDALHEKLLPRPYLTLVDGSLVEQTFPEKERAAIVNAANGGLLGGGGIDGVIWAKVKGPDSKGAVGTNSFRGQCLVLRRKKAQAKTLAPKNPFRGDIEPVLDGAEASYDDGEAGLTKAFGGLSETVGHVVHAVGPVGVEPAVLRNAYQNSLNRASEAKLNVIAFCPISTGIFGYDINLATPVAINAIVDWIKAHPGSGIEEIRLVSYSSNTKEYSTYVKTLRDTKLFEGKSEHLEEITAEAKDFIAKQLLNQSSKNCTGFPPLVFRVKKS